MFLVGIKCSPPWSSSGRIGCSALANAQSISSSVHPARCFLLLPHINFLACYILRQKTNSSVSYVLSKRFLDDMNVTDASMSSYFGNFLIAHQAKIIMRLNCAVHPAIYLMHVSNNEMKNTYIRNRSHIRCRKRNFQTVEHLCYSKDPRSRASGVHNSSCLNCST